MGRENPVFDQVKRYNLLAKHIFEAKTHIFRVFLMERCPADIPEVILLKWLQAHTRLVHPPFV